MTAKTVMPMADGRELIYFDAEPRSVTPPDDQRTLDGAAAIGAVRYDALFDEWVAVAGHRQTRTFLPTGGASVCPLCPSTPENQTEIPAAAYEVAVFENRFPSFSAPPPGWTMRQPEIGASGLSGGRCEVVCFSDEHDSSFVQLGRRRARLVIDAWADRTAALTKLDYVALVFPFENSGADIGVTISHPHGQIYAYPFLPPRVAAMMRASRQHLERTGRHLIDDVVAFEIAEGTRLVRATDSWVAFVPFAARWPFQVQLHPRRHVSDLAELEEHERDDLADLYLDVLGRLHGVYDMTMPYIAAWHQAPVGELRPFGRLHLDLFSARRAPDKLKYLAGSEAAMGAFINDVPPETAAQMLRDAAP